MSINKNNFCEVLSNFEEEDDYESYKTCQTDDTNLNEKDGEDLNFVITRTKREQLHNEISILKNVISVNDKTHENKVFNM